MFKKLLAGVTAAILSLGAVALIAGPASAHHNDINVSVSCATGPYGAASGAYVVTWTVKNSEVDKTETITSSSLPDVVAPTVTTFQPNETRVFTQSVSTAKDITLTLGAAWDNGYTNSNSNSIAAASFPSGCFHTSAYLNKVPSVCTGPNTFTDPTYTIGGEGVQWTINGKPTPAGTYPAKAGDHIIADVAASDPKYTIDGTTHWGYTFPAAPVNCTVKVVPVDATLIQQSCKGLGDHTQATFTVVAVTGVLYSIKIDGGAENSILPGTYPIADGTKTIQVIAKGDSANYYVIDNPSNSIVFPVQTVIDAGKCLTDVTPIDPSPTQAQCDVVVYPGVVPTSTYTLYFVEHLTYEVSTDGITYKTVNVSNPSSTFDVTPGTTHVYIKASVDDPTKYQIDGKSAWDLTFTDLGDCKDKVTPVTPGFSAQSCDVTDPNNPKQVEGSVIVTAAANVTYYIDGKPAQVGANPASPGQHLVTVSYDTTKFNLADGIVLPFKVTIAADPCDPTTIVTPAATLGQLTCFANGSYTLSTNPATAGSVVWTVNGQPAVNGKYSVTNTSTVTVHAEPATAAYGFPNGAQKDWTLNFKKPTVCDLETLAMTGQSPTGLLIAADVLLVGGLLAFAIRALRRQQRRAA
ncbi:hypothetical protein BH11ACT3_BH11ACT3_00340 [soil metagenome]